MFEDGLCLVRQIRDSLMLNLLNRNYGTQPTIIINGVILGKTDCGFVCYIRND